MAFSLEDLHIAHILKASLPAAVEASEVPGALFLNSCQRMLWVSDQPRPGGLSGMEAYRFLLRVACGLESEVVGETEIFGQLKDAWKKSSDLSPAVDYWVQKIFEDTKEIRSRHLENLGSATYGSLVRRTLVSAKSNGPTLLVGAGALAASVAPYLIEEGSELWILNRSVEKAEYLRLELLRNHPQAVIRVFEEGSEESYAVWREAGRIVVCVPGGAVQVREPDSRAVVLHLGVRRDQAAQAAEWLAFASRVSSIEFLDDLFRLQRAQGEARSIQVHYAERACDERAKLRALGGGTSVAHGWEDLAVFAL